MRYFTFFEKGGYIEYEHLKKKVLAFKTLKQNWNVFWNFSRDLAGFSFSNKESTKLFSRHL